jgi:catechol 2,3-dioxygenase-like lactoylglutathione lyase family enzyme
MLGKTTYATLFVSDQDRSLDFYTKVLGMTKLVDNRQPGGRRFLTVGTPGDDLQIILWPGSPGRSRGAAGIRVEGSGKVVDGAPGALMIETPDCQQAFEAFKARGATFEEAGPIRLPYVTVATIVDPDGNRLSIRELPKPAEA